MNLRAYGNFTIARCSYLLSSDLYQRIFELFAHTLACKKQSLVVQGHLKLSATHACVVKVLVELLELQHLCLAQKSCKNDEGSI